MLERLGLEKGRYILLSAHREENIDTEKNFLDLFRSVNRLAEAYDMPILYSCHPRSKKFLEQRNFKLDARVRLHEPLGFHDYNPVSYTHLARPFQAIPAHAAYSAMIFKMISTALSIPCLLYTSRCV